MLLLAMSGTALAQDAAPGWAEPLAGMGEVLFDGRKGLGFLIITPVDDEPTRAVETLIREQLTTSGIAELIMDDSPLGDLSGKSDDEIIAAGRKYPVDVVLLLRTFPGANGPTAVMRIETTEAAEGQSFRFRQGQEPPWTKKPTPTQPPSNDVGAVAATEAADFGRQNAAMARMGAIGVVETIRLIDAESERRLLSYESHPRSPVVRDPDGEVVLWLEAYQRMGRPDLAQRYRGRRRAKTASLAGGGLLAAAGVGLLFVGVANQTGNCGTGSGCARPALIGAGFGSVGLGAILIATGLILRPHPIPTAEIEAMTRAHNERLE